MADTPVSVLVPPGEYLDLYGATGIPRGAVLIVDNLGASPVFLATSATQPEPDTSAYQVIVARGLPMKNDGGSTGEWALSSNQTGHLSVRTA